MLVSLNTKASGKYKFYTEDNNGNLVLVSETPNLITKAGLNSIARQTWADAFTHILVGTGTTLPNINDTALQTPIPTIGAPSNVYPSNPASYTLATWNSSTGVTHRLGRSFKIDNPTATPYTVTEVGTSNGILGGNNVLFSRAVLTSPVVLPAYRFIYAVYELRLETGASTKVSDFHPEIDTAPSSYDFPTNKLGIINSGFAQVFIDGTTIRKNFTAGEAILEPSTTDLFLYKMTAAGGSTTWFDSKRAAFEADPTIEINNAVGSAPTYARFGYRESRLYDEVVGLTPAYQTDSFRRAKHIIVAPRGTTETIHGFTLSNIPGTIVSPFTTPTGLDARGIQCVFNTPWVRPADSFIKIYFEHNWSA
jgi:hypothetical protein